MRFLLPFVLLLCSAFASAQPFMGGQKPNEADVKKLQALEKAYTLTKAAFQKKPKDAAVKKKFIGAAVQYGHESMMSAALPPSVKYKQALRIYREVLKIDPNNKVAKPESDLIIKIYKDLGKPIPKD